MVPKIKVKNKKKYLQLQIYLWVGMWKWGLVGSDFISVKKAVSSGQTVGKWCQMPANVKKTKSEEIKF